MNIKEKERKFTFQPFLWVEISNKYCRKYKGSTESTFFAKLREFVKIEYKNCYFYKIVLLWETILERERAHNRIWAPYSNMVTSEREAIEYESPTNSNMIEQNIRLSEFDHSTRQKRYTHFRISLFQKRNIVF